MTALERGLRYLGVSSELSNERHKTAITWPARASFAVGVVAAVLAMIVHERRLMFISLGTGALPVGESSRRYRRTDDTDELMKQHGFGRPR